MIYPYANEGLPAWQALDLWIPDGDNAMGGSDLYTGTLDVLILKSLTGGERHGYAIGLWLRRSSSDVLDVQEGVLYPALHRLKRKGWVTSKWGKTETGRRAKFYRLTAAGRRQLAREQRTLADHSAAVLAILKQDAT